jgi:acetyl esterase
MQRIHIRALVVLTILAMAVAAHAQTTRPRVRAATDESTRTSIPGAEMHVYRDTKPEPLRLFVFKPEGWTAADKRSTFVFFFGGGWSAGTPQRSAGWAKAAAKWGMVGIAPDYRTRGRFGTSALEAVSDGRAAIKWIQDHAAELGVDPARVVVGGSSAGGHLALWTAITKPPPGSKAEESPTTKPAALVLISGASNTAYERFRNRMGAEPEAISPVHQLDAKMPPVVALHGQADTTVPLEHAVALRDKLIASGNECELTTAPQGGHTFTQQMPEWRTKAEDLVRAFLVKHALVDEAK